MMNEQPHYVDLNAALEILKTSRPTLYRWLRSGKIQGTKVGRQWRFKREDIERFLRNESPKIELAANPGALLEELGKKLTELAPGLPIPEDADPAKAITDRQIRLAQVLRASDLHLGPQVTELGGPHRGVLRFRVDGILQHPIVFDLRLVPALIQCWKQYSGCNAHECSLPQDGRIVMNLSDPSAPEEKSQLDLRIAFMPTAMGESMTVRFLDSKSVVLTLERASLAEDALRRLRKALHASNGLIISTGPTGSGKTTLMYMCMQEITSPDRKVISIEDPVEFYLPWVTQVPVREHTGMTFAKAARACLRSDPDVIMIGELRDKDSASICMQASLTGHQVLTQLHAPTAAAALVRLLDMGLDPFIVSESVSIVMSQRLVRALCPHCRRESSLDAPQLSYAREAADTGGLAWEELKPTWYAPAGCDQCGNTGYRGRRAITEVMSMTSSIKAAIRRQENARELQNLAVEDGMTTFAAEGVRRAASGETSIQEVMRVHPDPNDFGQG